MIKINTLILFLFFINITNTYADKLKKYAQQIEYMWAAIHIVTTSNKEVHHQHEASFFTKEECNNYIMNIMEKEDYLNFVYKKSNVFRRAIDKGGQIISMDPPKGMGMTYICMTIALPPFDGKF